jgi:hypothetical protein
MAVTLLVRWLSPVANLAARRCTASTLFMFFYLLGLHMLDVYSMVGRTKVVLHCALMVVGQWLTLRPKKA